MRSSGCPARCTTCSATTSRTWTPVTWPPSSACWIDDAFRRLGYRTQHVHEELGLPRPLHYMLRYNIENLDPGHLATIIGVLDRRRVPAAGLPHPARA